MSEWLPIESAPKDGTPVLLALAAPVDTSYLSGWFPPKLLPVVVGWCTGVRYRDGGVLWQAGYVEDGSADTEGYSSPISIDVLPTHWQPLPSPPT